MTPTEREDIHGLVQELEEKIDLLNEALLTIDSSPDPNRAKRTQLRLAQAVERVTAALEQLK